MSVLHWGSCEGVSPLRSHATYLEEAAEFVLNAGPRPGGAEPAQKSMGVAALTDMPAIDALTARPLTPDPVDIGAGQLLSPPIRYLTVKPSSTPSAVVICKKYYGLQQASPGVVILAKHLKALTFNCHVYSISS